MAHILLLIVSPQSHICHVATAFGNAQDEKCIAALAQAEFRPRYSMPAV